MEIDAALQHWRQGDLALDERWFIHAGDSAVALTDASAGAAEEGLQALISETEGLAVVTQTCDIVRTCTDRPFVEVAPLVRLNEATLLDVQRGRRPALATMPAMVSKGLAVDLDRIMTVEKSLVAKWQRTPGCSSDAEIRSFAQALARKRERFAFPDDFNAFAKKLQSRLIGKHEKETDEGRALRALREIRVQAAPDWNATFVTLFFWFIRDAASPFFEGKNWAELLDGWLALVPAGGRFTVVAGQVATLADLTGEDYVGSDPLDLDHLSA
ncbi:hypothetical protein D7X55_10325 [Corallococcus sp. AB049A]|uniref:hypothetical protein n=1 Tax=Corallococcus sp. AB049A TaxID=2316721 RepID=UPI000EA2F6D3|nr:hypothetical protein [Corallococcus sp. AB049A]RKH49440.1 hypothetical protein D7Y23_16905 [Corallococcus sp. AB050B]RKI70323.1 hypothetical protein D7X55_10325 [Corallococcus sp. AB049A]